MSKVKTIPKLCLDLDSPRGELKSNNLQLLVQRCLKSKQYQSYAWTWIRPGVSWFGLVWNPFLLTQIRSTRFQTSSGRPVQCPNDRFEVDTDRSLARCPRAETVQPGLPQHARLLGARQQQRVQPAQLRLRREAQLRVRGAEALHGHALAREEPVQLGGAPHALREGAASPTSWSRPKGAMPFFGKVLHPVRTLG